MPVQILDYSLTNFKVPGLDHYTPPFGTKKADGSGLTTTEITRNEMMPFMKQRPVSGIPSIAGNDPPMGVISVDSIATPIEFDANFAVAEGIQLQLDDPSYEGQIVRVVASFATGDPAVITLGVADNPQIIDLPGGEALLLFAVNGRWSRFENGMEYLIEAEAEARVAADALKAPLDSPAFTGTPKVPSKTGAPANNGTLIATEAQVYAHANLIAPHGEYPAGCFYEQYPDAPTPVEAGWPGTWEVWSNKAVIYGLRSTNSGSASIYIERQKCGNLLTASDLAVGAQVSSGAYAGYYVRKVVTLAGKFISIEGGNRPDFISGGVGQDQIRSIDGSYEFFSSSTTGVAGINPKGSITIAAGSVSYYNQISSINYATTLFKINTPNPGPDVAPETLSARYWRRIA
jgi:hypothetical protein